MKKVLIITYYWPPSGGAGVQRWVKFVKYLAASEIEPVVLTVDPSYASYPQTDPTLEKEIPKTVQVFYSKSFELYSLYKKVSSNKEIPYGGFANTKKNDFKEKVIRFIRGNFIIPDPRKGWNKYATAKAKQIIKDLNIDTVITTSPPHSTQLIGLKLKKDLGLKWIADFRDPWTDIYYFKQMYPTLPAMCIHKKLEKKVLDQADKIITVSKNFKKLFSEKTDNIFKKIEIIPNGFDSDDFKDISKTVHPEIFYISYVGTISKEYNVKGLTDALRDLPEHIISKTKVRFIGKVPDAIKEQFESAGLAKIFELKGYVKHHQVLEYLFASDLLLLIIPDVKNNEGIIPGKLFEYLASHKQILCLGPKNGDAAKVIAETESGIICDYSDYKSITAAIIKIYNQKKSTNNFDEAKILKYSRKNLTSQLITVLKSL